MLKIVARNRSNLTFFNCRISRSALLTARYPIHTGLQTNVIAVAQPSGLHKNETLFPQYMEECGVTQRHMVGKWHVGHGHHWMLPWNRGFQTFAGLYVLQWWTLFSPKKCRKSC